MNPLLNYLFQVIAASGLFYGYYHLALRNKKIHQYNRFYLLVSFIMVIIIPLFNIPVYFSDSNVGSIMVLHTLKVITSAVIISNQTTASTLESSLVSWFTIPNLVFTVYGLIACVFFLRIIRSINKLRKIIRNNTLEKIGKIVIVNTEEQGTPFSFFKWIFWNRKIELRSEKGEQIFRHEYFHIHQKHSWDILVIEILTAIFWINPFFHLMKKELKAIHEFLADEFTIKEDKKLQYAEFLLMQVFDTKINLVNPFFNNQIKRRISMLTLTQKSRQLYFRKILLFPLAAIVAILFACNYNQKDKEELVQQNSTSLISDSSKIKSEEKNMVVDNPETPASFPGGDTAWRKFLEKNLNANTPVNNGALPGTYKVEFQFLVNIDGSISDIKAISSQGYGMEEECLRIMKLSPTWKPAIQKGKKVTAYRIQPITFVISED